MQQPVGEKLDTFLEWAESAQDALFEREAGPTSPIKCPHHDEVIPEDKPAFRCFDCYHAPVVCEDCIIRYHLHNPFHRIEVWKAAAAFWERMSLGELGSFVLDLGHGGMRCPARQQPRQMTVVHEHGINEVKVRFCACVAPGEKFAVPEPVQLLRFGLFPGTWLRPSTVFTINGLRDYHLLSLQCQITWFDFATYLQRSTNNVVPSEVTVSSSSLLPLYSTDALPGPLSRAQRHYEAIHVPPRNKACWPGAANGFVVWKSRSPLPGLPTTRYEYGSSQGTLCRRLVCI